MKTLLCLLCLFVMPAAAASIDITDSRGKLSFAEPPQRVVVANWVLTEQLLELGITPVGVADIDGYQQAGYQTPIPAGVVELGNRLSPDLKKIKALKPDIILVGYSQKPLLYSLENLGTVVYFRHFSHRYDNEAQSRKVFLQLAKLFNKTEYAQQKLQQRDAAIEQYKQQLSARFKDGLPVLTMLVPERDTVWLFTENSMPYFAASRLGLSLSTTYPPSKFGVKKHRVDELPEQLGCVLVFAADKNADAAVLSKLKEKSTCLLPMPSINAYGGAMSIQYLAAVITEVLLKL